MNNPPTDNKNDDKTTENEKKENQSGTRTENPARKNFSPEKTKTNEGINVGIVGATGIVGEVFLQLMEERGFPYNELRLFASENSAGKTLEYQGQEITLEVPSKERFSGLDLVFFSSGDEISRKWAPIAVEQGAYAVDNSAAFRMNDENLLVVPEVNGRLLDELKAPALIANPNCSTIQLVVALAPLDEKFGLEAVKVSTYQSASGAGRDGMTELYTQMGQALNSEEIEHKTFSAPLAFNCIPQIGSIKDDGFCTEETKMMTESRKILGLPDLQISAFTVRVPTLVGHAESAWVTLKNEAELEEVTSVLKEAPGLDLEMKPYPMTQEVAGRDPVYVGRLHRDLYDAKTFILWVVTDNVRKGAALNGIQIAERIFDIN